MKKFCIALLLLTLALLAHPSHAERNYRYGYRSTDRSGIKKYTYKKGVDNIELRPGMELKKFGGINMVVPEGTQIYEVDGIIFMEGPEEYAARRFKEVEEKLTRLESKLDALTNSIPGVE